ncbi:MAG: GntR family transcriptional regulator [Rubrivivax sp.]
MDETLHPAGTPRYQQLSTLLAREIRAGTPAVGELLPPEPQLCARFGVSRHTLREAVRQLCEQGLVARHQGIGTRVLAAQAPARRYVAALGSLQELMQYTQQTRLRVLGSRERVADAALAAALRCDEGEGWLEIEACRHAADAPRSPPLVHMAIYVRPGMRALLDDLARGDAWVFGLVEKHGGERIVEAQQVVGALAMPAASARVLGVRARSPALRVRRYYLGRGGRLLSVSLNVYPADRFELATRWQLQSGGTPP